MRVVVPESSIEKILVLVTICVMYRSFKKLLSLLLICLLGLSPLQTALADTFSSSDQHGPTCTMPASQASHTEHALSIDSAGHDCDMCKNQNTCTSSCCSGGHCSTHVMALLQSFAATSLLNDLPLIADIQNIALNQQPPSLFRPPRA